MIHNSRDLSQSALLLSFLTFLAAPAVAGDHVVVAGESIQSAIDGAQAGDRILVHEGLYFEAIDFRGKHLEVIAVAGAEYTILDANGTGGAAVRATSGEPLGTSLFGFAIRRGDGDLRNDLGTDLVCGGGVLVAGGSHLAMTRCVLAGNGQATADLGGAVYAQGAGTRVDILNCVLHSNGAIRGGGGVAAVDGAHLQIESSTLSNNCCVGSSGVIAGLLVGGSATATLHESIVWGNIGVDLGAPSWLGLGVVTVSYSDIGGGWRGLGNQDVDPIFRDVAGQDYRLLDTSPCRDSGDPQSAPDYDGSLSDQGADMEYSTGAGDFQVYCDAKVNSAGCQADIFWTGVPSYTGPDDFHLGCSSMVNANFGVLIWGGTEASIPYMNATLCVQPPLVRKHLQFTAGNPVSGGADCSGNLHSAFAQSYMTGWMALPGSQVCAQYWYRDPNHSDGTGVALSNAVKFTVTP